MIRLCWDSEFWGKEIYNLDIQSLNKIKLYESKYDLIQCLVDLNDYNSIGMLEKYGFSFIESKVQLVKSIEPVKFKVDNIKLLDIDGINIDWINKDSLLFYQLFGENSRFRKFSKEKINDFYYKWLINSVLGQMDDACYGYFINENLAGFITYKEQGENLSIGLFGIIPEYQGNGISQDMLRFIESFAYLKGKKYLFVSTQGTNIAAINTYIKAGYKIESLKNWYYLYDGGF